MKSLPVLFRFLHCCILGAILFLVPAVSSSQVSRNDAAILSDKAIFYKLLGKFLPDKDTNAGHLLLMVASEFIDKPYLAGSLEIQPEQVVINLRGFDCTTLIESCLAVLQVIKAQDTSFSAYAEKLEFIRYRDGIHEGFTSRLHYFSEWIKNNEQKGILTDLSARLGGVPLELKLDFMSKHPGNYPAMAADSALVFAIQQHERQISKKLFHYIPEGMISKLEGEIQDGDIIALTSNMKGLDVAHAGLAIRIDGKIHLLNASSVHRKVEITKETLEEYLLRNKSMTGIILVRAR